MRRINPNLWQPHEIELEPEADAAVRDVDHCTVIVGELYT